MKSTRSIRHLLIKGADITLEVIFGLNLKDNEGFNALDYVE